MRPVCLAGTVYRHKTAGVFVLPHDKIKHGRCYRILLYPTYTNSVLCIDTCAVVYLGSAGDIGSAFDTRYRTRPIKRGQLAPSPETHQ